MKHPADLRRGPAVDDAHIGAVGGMVIVSRLTPLPDQPERAGPASPAACSACRRSTRPGRSAAHDRLAFGAVGGPRLPVLMRITTRVCHSRAAVEFGPLPAARPRGRFRKNPARFLPTPANARHLREELQRRLDRACELITASPFNFVHPAPDSRGAATAPRRGLISAGAPRNVVRHLALQPGLDLPHLELGVLHPLPHELIVPFLRTVDEVLVIEELTPYSMTRCWRWRSTTVSRRGSTASAMAACPPPSSAGGGRADPRVRRCRGDGSRRGPRRCRCRHVRRCCARAACIAKKPCRDRGVRPERGLRQRHRLPRLCGAAEAGDVLLAMGLIPMAAGIARTTGSGSYLIGDSTFFHSGMPALRTRSSRTTTSSSSSSTHVTAMTGMQRNAARACGRDVARAAAHRRRRAGARRRGCRLMLRACPS